MEQIKKPELWQKGPNQAADAVVLSQDGYLLLILRRSGQWALPGGFVNEGETTAEASRREVSEETRLELSEDGMLCYSGKVEDPRNSEDRWIESDAYLYLLDARKPVEGQDDAEEGAEWFPLAELPKLYGSHDEIVRRALAMIDEN